MANNTNVGYAFPLEKLGSDIARNDFNYQSILNGLVEWNNTTSDTVKIRLTKDTAPFFEDYIIPSKKSVYDLNSMSVDVTGIIAKDSFFIDGKLDTVFYGGTIKTNATLFTPATSINTTTYSITLPSYTGFEYLSQVKVYSTDGNNISLIGLSTNQLYYIMNNPLVDGYIQLTDSIDGTIIELTASASIDNVGIVTYQQYPETLASDPGDLVTLRYTVVNSGNSDWQMYYYPITYAWTSGNSYRFDNIVEYSNIKYKCLFNIASSTVIPSTDTVNFKKLFQDWVSNTQYYTNDIVIFNNSLYLVKNDVNDIIAPTVDSNYELYANVWVSTNAYAKGSYVYYNYNNYIALNAVNGSSVVPSTDTTNWVKLTVFKIPANTFSESYVNRWTLNSDVAGLIMRNIGVSSNENTNINVRVSMRTKEPASIYQRSVDSFATSNYTMWPDYNNTVWKSGDTYGPTDDAIGISSRQLYSASMIFDHTDLKNTKTINYINYDGPDLDQGLCVYLPISVNIADGGTAVPEDGFTFEFFFRIWPSNIYTGAVTRDHIVNKSQIYVYSVDERDNIATDNCGTPIAKFSMARTTNYYLFQQNISIPDKPVCYRATFVYSSARNTWVLLDYYQLPDHIFMGPVGFIDPQNPANFDINGINGGLPNPTHIGYETAAFPLFQDPFSNSDLSPYTIETDGTTSYIKRILS